MPRSKKPCEKELLERALRLVSDHVGEIGGAAASAAVKILRAAADRAGGERNFRRRARIIVLFADLAGYTPYSEATDAEEVSAFVGGLWEHLDHLVHAAGGRVLQHFGDAILAVWGDETAREDDAERALECAAAILGTVPAYIQACGLEAGKTAPPGMRVGIHAGPAFVGEIGSVGEYAVLGDTVNAAARLQTAATPGQTVFSEAVLRLLKYPPVVRELPPLALKGKTEAIKAYTIAKREECARESASYGPTLRPARSGRKTALQESSMVGREQELRALSGLFEGIAAHGLARTALVLGDAGIGKSRLIAEFLSRLPVGTGIIVASARETARDSPNAFLRSIIGREADILDSDPGDMATAKLVSHAEAIGLEKGIARAFARFLGYEGPAETACVPIDEKRGLTSEGGYALLAAYLRARSRETTLVITLEDMTWADAASRSAIEDALESLSETPILALLASREETEFRSADARIRLDSLPSKEAAALASSLLEGLSPIPSELLEFSLSRAEGNPYFIEECVRFLFDRGAVDRSASPWAYDARKLPKKGVPLALADLLQARLDALEPADRGILETASVFGRVFWLSALSARGRPGGRAAHSNPRKRLEALAERGLVLKNPASTVAGTEEWCFAHNLLRDVAYDRVLKSDRPELHERAARWLLDHLGSSAAREAAVIAEHFAHAGRPSDAAGLFAAAGDMADRVGDPRAAARLYKRALDSESLPPAAKTRIAQRLAGEL